MNILSKYIIQNERSIQKQEHKTTELHIKVLMNEKSICRASHITHILIIFGD